MTVTRDQSFLQAAPVYHSRGAISKCVTKRQSNSSHLLCELRWVGWRDISKCRLEDRRKHWTPVILDKNSKYNQSLFCVSCACRPDTLTQCCAKGKHCWPNLYSKYFFISMTSWSRSHPVMFPHFHTDHWSKMKTMVRCNKRDAFL